MRVLKLIAADKDLTQKGANPGTRTLIEAAIKQPPLLQDGRSAGFGVDAMRKRMRILDALEADDGKKELFLEDADGKVLKKCVADMRWGSVSQHILDFVDAVDKMEEVKDDKGSAKKKGK